MASIDEVRTPELIGRRPRPEDEGAWVAFWTDSRVDEEQWPADLRTADDARAVLRSTLAHWERWGFGAWTVIERDSGEIVGRVGLQHTDATGSPEVEVAWFIAADHVGRGFATAMARQALRVAFEVLGLDALVAMTTVANVPSQRVLGKLGFALEGQLERRGLAHLTYRLQRQ